jgi:hypothetical protein
VRVTLVASLIQAGVVGAILTAIVALVRIAIGAERRRADDWRSAAQTSAAANAVLAGNVERLISSVEQLSASQREMLVLLQTIATPGRSAA